MQSRWNDDEAARFADDALALRAYTSRLLGADRSLVLHGGGNTSLKRRERDFVGDEVDVLWVKGSGWDLATIEPAGFAPVRLRTLLAMGARDTLSDSVMVKEQRAAMLDPDAPVPSIEAVLHALIPAPWVDHTHADAVVALSSTPDGEASLRALFGERVLYVPYVMPGFELAKVVQRLAADVRACDGLILLQHGVFTWGDSARESYERMIALVSRVEAELARRDAWDVCATAEPSAPLDPLALGALRRAVGGIALVDRSPAAVGFSLRPDAAALATRGPLTPDHVIRTKRLPLVLAAADVSGPAAPERMAERVAEYRTEYRAYFDAHHQAGDVMLDPRPRWVVWPGQGLVSFGATVKDADIVRDLAHHTVCAIQRAEAAGGWRALSAAELYRMEYWELEQRKLGKAGVGPMLGGRVALVTGAAHGIGKATVAQLTSLGATVIGVDIDPAVASVGHFGIACDVTDGPAVDAAIAAGVARFGGLDLLVSNAGTFPVSARLEALPDALWQRTLALNLDAHMRVLRAATPHLAQGFEPAVVFVASKNVPAPGPGVAAYSVAKAGLTQLARVAALELGDRGVRVNVVHPDAVFDTDLWTADKIAARAANYGLTVEAYKTRNVLRREVRAADVARVVARLMTSDFAATTGAQISIDGGNDRVI